MKPRGASHTITSFVINPNACLTLGKSVDSANKCSQPGFKNFGSGSGVVCPRVRVLHLVR